MNFTEEQQKAIDTTKSNIIVSAGAGSGKTAVLTARVIRIIKEKTHVNELLVLTFTNAAAAEMKERIREAIAEDPSLKDELELVDQSYITTFDSFALSIVKKYHYLLNISNNIAISEETVIKMKKAEILDDVFDNYYQNPTPEFTNLIRDFCVKDDVSIKESILKISDKIDAKPDREEYLNNYLTNFTCEEFLNKIYEEYIGIINNLKQKCNNAYEDYIDCLNEANREKLSLYGDAIYNAKTIDEMIIAFNNKKSKPTFRLDEQTSCLRQNYYDAEDELSTILKYSNEETIKEGLKISNTYIKAILDIINEYLKRLHEYKAKNEIYDFQDIALLSIKILKENESVREELKENFKEIMVDEYQDTNDIQEAFISMIENNNVYMVGDIKQSIYRFRNANPYIFKNKYDAYKNNENGVKIDLLDNFRSREEVLKGINDIFDLIMDNNIGGAEYQESHRMVYGNKSYSKEGKTDQDNKMEILEYPYDKDTPYTKEEVEIFAIARDIQKKINNKYQVFDKKPKKLRDISYSDFVILIDRGAEFDTYKKVFEYLGIPLTLYKEEKFNEADDFYIIKNIIDLIVNINGNNFAEQFKYDFISIARSYLYNYDDQTIFNYFKNNNFTESSIYNDFKDISNELTHLSISNLLEYIINKTNMYEKLITVGDIDVAILRINKLMDVANNLSTLGYNIYTFRDYLNDLIEKKHDMKYSIDGSNSDSVKLMTIHKSKGLEYHICYYPGLFKEFNIDEIKERFTYDNRYGIVTPYFQDGIHETITKYLVKYHYLEEEVGERIRLFYVALTRAQEKMILLTPSLEPTNYELESNGAINESIRRHYMSFSKILESIKPYIEKYYKEIDINDLEIDLNYQFNKTKLKDISITTEPIQVKEISIKESEELENKHFSKTTHELINKNTYENMQLGLKVHEIFELLDFKNPDYSLIDDEFIKDKVQKFLSLDILKNIKDSTIYKEHEFIYELDNTEYHGIIDLMVEHVDHIDIIDYKLNNVKDENYLLQLNGYKNYINTISNKEVNIYLYSIIGETLEKL